MGNKDTNANDEIQDNVKCKNFPDLIYTVVDNNTLSSPSEISPSVNGTVVHGAIKILVQAFRLSKEFIISQS